MTVKYISVLKLKMRTEQIDKMLNYIVGLLPNVALLKNRTRYRQLRVVRKDANIVVGIKAAVQGVTPKVAN